MKKFGTTGLLTVLMLLATVVSALAADGVEGGAGGLIAIGAGVGLGLAAAGGGIGQGLAVASALESIGRNPNAVTRIQPQMIIGLAFIESLVIYALVIAFIFSGKF